MESELCDLYGDLPGYAKVKYVDEVVQEYGLPTFDPKIHLDRHSYYLDTFLDIAGFEGKDLRMVHHKLRTFLDSPLKKVFEEGYIVEKNKVSGTPKLEAFRPLIVSDFVTIKKETKLKVIFEDQELELNTNESPWKEVLTVIS